MIPLRQRSRRRFLRRSAAGLLGWRLAALGAPAVAAGGAQGAAQAGPASAAQAQAAARAWSNWSGSVTCQPRQWQLPGSLDELASAMKSGAVPLRCMGAGHSFTPLVATEGTLLSLDRLTGLVAHDKARGSATFRAGTRIATAMQDLDAAGLAFVNQPDVSTQSLAGAFATGTHGTGIQFGAMHSEITEIQLMTADGELRRCSAAQQPELFLAAQVSLGCLGVITEVTLNVRPRHFLHRRVWAAPIGELLEQATDLSRKHRHFEMFLLPFTGYGAAVVHDEVPIGAVNHAPSADEEVLADLQRLRDWLGWWPALRRWVGGRAVAMNDPEESTDVSWKLLTSTRPTRFNESEGHVPRAAGVTCLREVLAALETHDEAFFPVEFRYIQGDLAWLSPFHARDSCSIAVHAKHDEAHDYLVGHIGQVFRRHQARPHWGKLHDCNARELAALYPRWNDFLALRRELDPQGRLLTPYLRGLLGLGGGT